MKKDENILGTYPIGKLLLKLSIPTVIAQLINMLYNIVDRIYIGHIPVEGSLALTGVGVCLPIIIIVTAFAAVCSLDCGRFTSRAEGKTKVEVTIKKISSRNMTSVIDAILNTVSISC